MEPMVDVLMSSQIEENLIKNTFSDCNVEMARYASYNQEAKKATFWGKNTVFMMSTI